MVPVRIMQFAQAPERASRAHRAVMGLALAGLPSGSTRPVEWHPQGRVATETVGMDVTCMGPALK